jgi:acetyltransferase-like isoleucine patch superfamily enzyme
MRSYRNFIATSSVPFFLHRTVRFAFEFLDEKLLDWALIGALGSRGANCRIDGSVRLVTPKQIHLGSNCHIARGARIYSERESSELVVGDGTTIGRNAVVDYTGGIVFGRNLLISEGVEFHTHNHVPPDFVNKEWSPLLVGDAVWFGTRVIVLPSVQRIGSRCIIGAGSVVTKDVDEGLVVAGNPARPVKTL